jgi:hypothetical protein
LTGAVIVGGFYFTTTSTLATHTVELQKDAEQREKLRDALVQSSQDTQKAISSLAQTAAAQSEQIKGINTMLDRVVSGLQTLSVGQGKR